ncbi:MAG: hypothetical protein WAO95_16850 [Burkholderiales bacterium]
MKSTLLAAALALVATTASAQAIYTTVSLDGHKTFSDRADTIPEAVPKAAADSDAPKARGRRSLVPARLSAAVNVLEAERRLAQAQQKRSKAMAPLAGESDRVPGGIVVNARYLRRQERLDREVGQAERRAIDVRQAQLAQR